MTRISSTDQVSPEVASVRPVAAAGLTASRAVVRARRVGERIVAAVLVLLGAATAAFLAQASLPGDRATTILNIRSGQAVERTPDELAPIIAQFGLDRPLVSQYLAYMGGLVRGDLGVSYQQFRPVWDIVGEQLWATLVLSLTAIALAWLIMVIWVTSTAGRGPRTRAVGEFADTVTAGLPHYWLGIVLLLVFALNLGWFPVLGGTGPEALLLPALTLAIPLAGFMGQATRAEFERGLAQPFVVSARMRGMSDTGVRLRHVLRHAVLPAVTLSGWALGATISGAVVVESIFNRPGIGRVLVTAVSSQDIPVVTGIVVVIAAFYVVANLIVDLVYTAVDPRVRIA